MSRRLSTRLRLTLWYTAIMAASLLVIAVAVFLFVREGLWDTLEGSIRNRALVLASLGEFDAAGRPSFDLGGEESLLKDSFLRYFDASGSLIADNSEQFDPVSLTNTSSIDRALRGRGSFSTEYELDDGDEVRIYTLPLSRQGGDRIAGVLQVGESTEEIHETTNTMLLVFGIASPVALIVVGVGGWWLAGRALAPVNRITRLARDIAGGDLSRRLNLDLGNDEVGKLARTFDEMIARLESLVQRQRRFAADASHELRTPLAAIRGQVDVALQRERTPGEYRATLDSINGQLARLTRLVEDMLVAARSEAGAIPLQIERLDAGDLVESVAEQVRPLAEAKGLGLEVERGPPAEVDGDESLLLQLLLNLGDNAIRYTETGGVTLGWRADRNEVEMFVRDTGPGIPEEDRERVFEPFFRGDRSRSGEAGSGLGLSISRWIAGAHHGRLDFVNLERGVVFKLTLPGRRRPDPRLVH